MKDNVAKTLLSAVATAAASKLGHIAIPIALLLCASIFDYATGICAAKYRGNKISSKVSINGIFKKLALFSTIIACMLVDVFLIYVCEATGMKIGFYFMITIFVTIMMFINEIISILENLVDMDTYIPKWLIPFVKNIQNKVEKKAADTMEDVLGKEEDVNE